MNQYLEAQITEHCQIISRGSKPMSLFPAQSRYVENIKTIIKDNHLHSHFESTSDPLWITVYIYRDKGMKALIKSTPDEPETPTDHALLGYMLGYDTKAILDFIEKQTN